MRCRAFLVCLLSLSPGPLSTRTTGDDDYIYMLCLIAQPTRPRVSPQGLPWDTLHIPKFLSHRVTRFLRPHHGAAVSLSLCVRGAVLTTQRPRFSSSLAVLPHRLGARHACTLTLSTNLRVYATACFVQYIDNNVN